MQVVLRATDLPLPRLAAHRALDAPRPVFVGARLRKIQAFNMWELVSL